MSTIGSNIELSIIQTAQQQQAAAKARDRKRAREESTREVSDEVDLSVGEVESSHAIRKLPKNESEQAGDEHHRSQPAPPHGKRRIDLTA